MPSHRLALIDFSLSETARLKDSIAGCNCFTLYCATPRAKQLAYALELTSKAFVSSGIAASYCESFTCSVPNISSASKYCGKISIALFNAANASCRLFDFSSSSDPFWYCLRAGSGTSWTNTTPGFVVLLLFLTVVSTKSSSSNAAPKPCGRARSTRLVWLT